MSHISMTGQKVNKEQTLLRIGSSLSAGDVVYKQSTCAPTVVSPAHVLGFSKEE